MNGSDKFSPEIQRYLDGELPADAVDSSGRAEADRLLEAAVSFSGDLELPGAEIDRAVMASIRARPVKERESFWSWLFQPHAYQLRPALAAICLIGATTALRTMSTPIFSSSVPLTLLRTLIAFSEETPQHIGNTVGHQKGVHDQRCAEIPGKYDVPHESQDAGYQCHAADDRGLQHQLEAGNFFRRHTATEFTEIRGQ